MSEEERAQEQEAPAPAPAGAAAPKPSGASKVADACVCAIGTVALMVCLVAVGYLACAVPDVATRALSGAFATDEVSPFTHDELVEAAVAAKHYTFDTNERAEVYAAVIAANESAAADGRAGEGALDVDAIEWDADAWSNGAATPTQAELAQVEEALAQASEQYVLDADALSHLDDVYAVALAVRPVLLGALVVAFVCSTAAAFRRGARTLGSMLMVAAGAVVTAFVALAVWVVADFNGFFATFHSLFFAAGTWTFSADSLLICMYPTQFWIGMGAVWLAATLAGCIVCLIIGRLLRTRARRVREA